MVFFVDIGLICLVFCLIFLLMLQVDGPTHYIANAVTGELIPNTRTNFRNRLLKRLGWRVISIGYDEVPMDTTQREMIIGIQRKLNRAAEELESEQREQEP